MSHSGVLVHYFCAFHMEGDLAGSYQQSQKGTDVCALLGPKVTEARLQLEGFFSICAL